MSGMETMSKVEYRQFYDEIFDAISEGVMIVDPSGIIRMVNAAMVRLTGFREHELIGKPCSVLKCDACERVRSESNKNWCRLFEKKKVNGKHCMITNKNGKYVTMVKNATILKDEEERVVGALEIYTDISKLTEKDVRIQELSRILSKDYGFHGMLGQSPAMQNVFQVIEKATQSEATILISGESGTGKELVARAIHEKSLRKDGPYVKINCAALSESLIESELFGHSKGAFTGAHKHRKGLFEIAHGGDLFLDEIGDLPLSVQVKLLRVLETKEFIRLGGEQPIFSDVRILTATNKDLVSHVATGTFREDLFYRINVFPIQLPPLREKKEDIPLLVNKFIYDFRKKSGRRITGLTSEVMDLFMNYDWPGNVRELKSALEYSFAIGASGLLEVEDLPPQFQEMKVSNLGGSSPTHPTAKQNDSPEKIQLMDVLRKTGGNQSRAARLLGVHRMTIFNRMRKYGIDSKDFS
jgi:PAS domain S-box-containing protein